MIWVVALLFFWDPLDTWMSTVVSLEPDLTDLWYNYITPLNLKVHHAEYFDRADNLFAAPQSYSLLPYLPLPLVLAAECIAASLGKPSLVHCYLQRFADSVHFHIKRLSLMESPWSAITLCLFPGNFQPSSNKDLSDLCWNSESESRLPPGPAPSQLEGLWFMPQSHHWALSLLLLQSRLRGLLAVTSSMRDSGEVKRCLMWRCMESAKRWR